MTNATLRFFSGRPILSHFFICSAVILAACLINALSISFDAARYGEGIAPWKPYAQELSSWAGWSVTFMVLLPWDDKVAGQGLGVPARLAVYALSSVFFSAIHVVVMAGLRYPAWALAGARYHFDWGFDTLFYEYRKDLLGLFLAAGQAALWRKGSRKKEEPVTAAPVTELGESRVEFDNRDSASLSASRRAEVVRALAAH